MLQSKEEDNLFCLFSGVKIRFKGEAEVRFRERERSGFGISSRNNSFGRSSGFSRSVSAWASFYLKRNSKQIKSRFSLNVYSLLVAPLVTYSNSQILADFVVYVEGGTNQNTTLAPGSHVYPFSFAMPNPAPASKPLNDRQKN